MKGLTAVFRKYQISRAFLFGSVRSGACRKDSDIDLYVEGLDPETYWELWRAIEEDSGENVDLYYEKDDPYLVRRIIETGELIYEA